MIGRFPARLRRRLPWKQADAELERLATPAHGGVAAPAPAVAAVAGETFRALRNRNYRLYFIGQSISLCGTWMQTIAQAWLVLELTNSKVALGTVTLLQFLPITIFVLFAGVIADRVPKRNFIVGTQTLAMIQALMLAALVWSGHIQLWHIYVLAVMLGVANAFEQPTRQAFVVEMVGRDDLMNAVTLNSGLFNTARLLGPAIGGFVIATVGVKVAFLLNGISFVPVIIGLLMMSMADLYGQARLRAVGRVNPLAEIREGLQYAFRTPAALLIVILVAIVGTFGYNFTVVLPLVDKYVLNRGAAGLGFLTAAVGLGALISALSLASRKSATKYTLFAGGAAFSVLLGFVAFSQWYFVTLAFLLLLGVANTAFAATANTSLQLATPDHLRGRVMALYMLLFAGSTPIGGFLTGWMADRLGVRTAIGIEAVVCMIGVAAGLLYYVSHREKVLATSDVMRVAG
ncbi:MAG: MFS transporter [Dehalococcoidia bacterium]|nr:MFS transporter [Dehalococcoidia bacterium]